MTGLQDDKETNAEHIVDSTCPTIPSRSNEERDCRSLEEKIFPCGTDGLRVLYEPAAPSVDIVFVHGLTGNSYETWLDAESEVYWPVYLLSMDIPNARILAFGHDTDVTRFLAPMS